MKLRVFISFCIISWVLFPHMSHARPQPFVSNAYKDGPVTITAVHLNYDKKNNELEARGDVEIVQGDRILKADFIRIDTVTKNTHARGSVELHEGEDSIFCDAFTINLDTRLGAVSEAKIAIRQQNIYIEGAEAERLGIDTYRITNGTITTCSGDTPAWKITAGHIDLTVEGYAKVRNSTFRIRGIPVAYFPYLILPVKTKRQSGLLIPEFRHSSSDGYQFSNAFFWALSDSTDATLWLDAATQKGLGAGMEYRFLLGEKTRGKLYGYFADERESFIDDEYRDRRDRDSERGYLHFEGEHYFNSNLYARAQMSYLTDREMYGDYRKEILRSRGESDKSDLRTKEKDESHVFINKNWAHYNLLMDAALYKNLMQADPFTLQTLPRIALSGMRRPLKGPLYYQIDAAYDYFWREEGQRGHRLMLFPKLSLPLSYQGWLKCIPEFGLNGVSHFQMHKNRYGDDDGIFPTARFELTAAALKVFDVDSGPVTKLMHTIEPGILYEYVRTDEQIDYPLFDVPKHFFRRHSLSYYIKNRFNALLTTPAGTSEEREIGYFLLGQTYNFNEPKGGLYLQGHPERHLSYLFGELRCGIWSRIYFKTKAQYSTHDNSLWYYNALLNWTGGHDNFLELEYIYARERFEGFDVEGTIRLTGFLNLFFDARYDTKRNEDFDTEVGIDYKAQCWGSRVSLEKSSGRGGRSSDTSIHFSFYLRGLGGEDI